MVSGGPRLSAVRLRNHSLDLADVLVPNQLANRIAHHKRPIGVADPITTNCFAHDLADILGPHQLAHRLAHHNRPHHKPDNVAHIVGPNQLAHRIAHHKRPIGVADRVADRVATNCFAHDLVYLIRRDRKSVV